MEDANVVYGRLRESVHTGGYTMERAYTALKYLLTDGRWKSVGDGFHDVQKFFDSLKPPEGFRYGVKERKELAKLFAAAGVPQRTAAKALGVDHRTVGHDLGEYSPSKERQGRKQAGNSQNDGAERPLSDASGEHSPPSALAVSGADAAKLAEQKAKRDAKTAANDGDEWYTPAWLFKSLGLRFSMDVCAPVDLTHVATPAKRFLTEADDGLSAKWTGTVWCNPPYSTPEPWALKCIDHGDGLLLVHMPMNAEWCVKVWETCSGIRLFQAMEFLRPDGTLQRPGYWLQLAAFGDTAAAALADMKVPDDVGENPRRVPSPMWVRARL